MKIMLVVAAGAHQGKEIPIAAAQFVIGREEGCQLRPASPAISKKHCAFLVKSGRVFLADLGSTNGTFVNDEQIVGERELVPGDHIKVGPLEFKLQITGKSDSTPLPEQLKSVDSPAQKKLADAAGGSKAGLPAPPKPTPAPSQPVKSSDADDAAALLLGMDDDDPSGAPQVPEGSTVMEMPSVDAGKKAEEKKAPTKIESSTAADELLRKYLRRPK